MNTPSKQNAIPLHRLSEVSDLGLEMHRFPGDFDNLEQHMLDLGVHRDDHYVFLLQERGRSRYWVDFEEWVFEGRGLWFMTPGQVHAILSVTDVAGWFIAADAHLMPDALLQVFQGVVQQERLLPLCAGEDAELIQCLDMILSRKTVVADNLLLRPVLHTLFGAFAGLVAERYAQRDRASGHKESRASQVHRQFRVLLEQRFREEKRPGAYAAALNLSLSYLNEMVRSVSGLPVGHWIQYEVMLEARRLLYHSDKTVQEIAYGLGYEDAAYFSRLFRQVVGQSPAQFRQLFRG